MTAPDRAPDASAFRHRRRRDRLIAAAIAVLVAAAGVLIYLRSDIRAVEASTGPGYSPAAPMSTVPDRLVVAWQQPTDPAVGAVASPYGTVVTTDAHTVTGRNAADGEVRWSYSRSNRELCTVGSGDTAATDLDTGGAVRGILALYARDGYCGEMVLLDPRTGERRYQRTAPNALDGSLIFGGPYAAWVSDGLMEIWRYDLYRTFQYGNQPTPKEKGTRHLDCTFTDAMLAAEQFATVEHCSGDDDPVTAQVMLNWADPNTHNDDWGDQKTEVRAEIDTGSTTARIVGLTKDRVAVLVDEPSPAVIVYDADGSRVSRTPVVARSTDLAAGTGPTPRVTLGEVQYSLVGDRLFAVGSHGEQVTVTVTPSTDEQQQSTGDRVDDLLDDSSASTSSTGPHTETETRETPGLLWTLDGAIGLPTLIGDQLLVPSRKGLMVVPADQGVAERTIGVDRPGDPGRVDVSVVGKRIVEVRPDAVVALKGAP